MRTKKKRIAYFLVLIILCPVLIVATLCMHKKVVQHRMTEKMEYAILQKIIIKKDAVVWIKMKKEISVNGRMFDVKSYSVKNDTIVFKGLYDEDEKAIINNINKLANKNTDGSLPALRLLKILLMPSAVEQDFFNCNRDLDESNTVFFTYQESAVQQYNPIFIPPPNF